MTCPKCEEGNLTKVKFKNLNKYSFICEFCGVVWYEKEMIANLTGHVFESSPGIEKPEYSFDDTEFDLESKDIKFAKFK